MKYWHLRFILKSFLNTSLIQNIMAKRKSYDLRTAYNMASMEALAIMLRKEKDGFNRACLGIYCEALYAIKEAIAQGATTNDLEKAIERANNPVLISPSTGLLGINKFGVLKLFNYYFKNQ